MAGEAGKGLGEVGIGGGRGRDRAGIHAALDEREPLEEPAEAPAGSAVVRQHPARDAVQPGQLAAVRDVANAAPGDRHDLREQVLHRIGGRAAREVAGQRIARRA